jgi:hypothetical protein
VSIGYDTHVLIGREKGRIGGSGDGRARRKKKVESTQDTYSDIIYSAEQNNRTMHDLSVSGTYSEIFIEKGTLQAWPSGWPSRIRTGRARQYTGYWWMLDNGELELSKYRSQVVLQYPYMHISVSAKID